MKARLIMDKNSLAYLKTRLAYLNCERAMVLRKIKELKVNGPADKQDKE